MDTFPGFDPKMAWATAVPGAKAANTRRIAIEVDIPDPELPDVVIKTALVSEVPS